MPSALDIFPAKAITAIVKTTPGSASRSKMKWPATAPSIAPIGPPARNPAAAPLTLPQIDTVVTSTHRNSREEFCGVSRSVARSVRMAREHARRTHDAKGPRLRCAPFTGIIVEKWAEPTFSFLDRPSLTAGVIFHLVTLDL